MKRSKSALTQKHKKQVKADANKANKKGLKLQSLNTVQTHQNLPKTQRPHTARNTVEDRLNKIRQGFQKLQRNLNFDHLNKSEEYDWLKNEDLTSKKVGKKLFTGESNKKTVTKNTSKDRRTFKKPVHSISPMKYTPRSNNNYHSCIYEKSLYDLMKILAIQKNEIARLKSQIRVINNKQKII